MIKVKKLNPNAKLPERAHPTDAGADLFSVEEVILTPGNWYAVSTGIAINRVHDIFSPTIYHRIAPRSGLAAKYGIFTNGGVVDDAYRGK